MRRFFLFFFKFLWLSNVFFLLYLGATVFLIATIIQSVLNGGFMMPTITSLEMGLLVYAVATLFAMSSVGEEILESSTHISDWIRNRIIRVNQMDDYSRPRPRKLGLDELQQVDHLFREVYEQACSLSQAVPRDVTLCVQSGDFGTSAFVYKRKKICMTQGMFMLPDEQIRAALAHAIGHMVHFDVEYTLMIYVGSLFLNIFAIVTGLVVVLLTYVVTSVLKIFIKEEHSQYADAFSRHFSLLIMRVVTALMQVWTQFGFACSWISRRQGEYYADLFAADLGYGTSMRDLIRRNETTTANNRGVLELNSWGLPNANHRINHLDKLEMNH